MTRPSRHTNSAGRRGRRPRRIPLIPGPSWALRHCRQRGAINTTDQGHRRAMERGTRVLIMTAPLVSIGPTRRDYAEKAVRDGGGEPADVDPDADALVWLSPTDIAGLRDALQVASSARWVQLPAAGVERMAAVGLFGDGRTW